MQYLVNACHNRISINLVSSRCQLFQVTLGTSTSSRSSGRRFHSLSLLSKFLDNLRQSLWVHTALDHRDADRQSTAIKMAV